MANAEENSSFEYLAFSVNFLQVRNLKPGKILLAKKYIKRQAEKSTRGTIELHLVVHEDKRNNIGKTIIAPRAVQNKNAHV